MMNRKYGIFVPISFALMSVVLLFIGVKSGLQRSWFRMGLTFLLAVFLTHVCVYLLLELRIDSCFKRLEELATKQSDSASSKNA